MTRCKARPFATARRAARWLAFAAFAAAVATGLAHAPAAPPAAGHAIAAFSRIVTASVRDLSTPSLTITVPVASIGIRG